MNRFRTKDKNESSEFAIGNGTGWMILWTPTTFLTYIWCRPLHRKTNGFNPDLISYEALVHEILRLSVNIDRP
jgi:hypothetical protein